MKNLSLILSLLFCTSAFATENNFYLCTKKNDLNHTVLSVSTKHIYLRSDILATSAPFEYSMEIIFKHHDLVLLAIEGDSNLAQVLLRYKGSRLTASLIYNFNQKKYTIENMNCSVAKQDGNNAPE